MGGEGGNLPQANNLLFNIFSPNAQRFSCIGSRGIRELYLSGGEAWTGESGPLELVESTAGL